MVSLAQLTVPFEPMQSSGKVLVGLKLGPIGPEGKGSGKNGRSGLLYSESRDIAKKKPRLGGAFFVFIRLLGLCYFINNNFRTLSYVRTPD